MAKKYVVSIQETLEKQIEVIAESSSEAKKIVDEQYYKQEIVLDSNDYSGVEFYVLNEVEVKNEQ